MKYGIHYTTRDATFKDVLPEDVLRRIALKPSEWGWIFNDGTVLTGEESHQIANSDQAIARGVPPEVIEAFEKTGLPWLSGIADPNSSEATCFGEWMAEDPDELFDTDYRRLKPKESM